MQCMLSFACCLSLREGRERTCTTGLFRGRLFGRGAGFGASFSSPKCMRSAQIPPYISIESIEAVPNSNVCKLERSLKLVGLGQRGRGGGYWSTVSRVVLQFPIDHFNTRCGVIEHSFGPCFSWPALVP